MRAAVSKITNDDYCPGQNDRRVRAHETDLHVTHRLTELDHRAPELDLRAEADGDG